MRQAGVGKGMLGTKMPCHRLSIQLCACMHACTCVRARLSACVCDVPAPKAAGRTACLDCLGLADADACNQACVCPTPCMRPPAQPPTCPATHPHACTQGLQRGREDRGLIDARQPAIAKQPLSGQPLFKPTLPSRHLLRINTRQKPTLLKRRHSFRANIP